MHRLYTEIGGWLYKQQMSPAYWMERQRIAKRMLHTKIPTTSRKQEEIKVGQLASGLMCYFWTEQDNVTLQKLSGERPLSQELIEGLRSADQLTLNLMIDDIINDMYKQRNQILLNLPVKT